VRYAGGHDPGPIAVPEFDNAQSSADEPAEDADNREPAPAGGAEKPFLPPPPPIELGTPTAARPAPGADPGPWGPHGGTR